MESEILETIRNGHNCIILGQAGTGKTSLLRKIYSEMIKHRSVRMTATTGMSSLLLNGCTVHKFAGIGDGRYSDDVVINKIMYDSDYREVKERIVNTDCFIIDEISMLSRKLFNQIETIFRTVRGVNIAFGGMQVVLSGDFFQLKPVPNIYYGDAGELIISDPRFMDIIPHRFVLNTVHRQTEEQLIKAVHELSQSRCSTETEKFLQTLERPLPDDDTLSSLFALNYDVEKCNSDYLLAMEGETTVFNSIHVDDGDNRALTRCVAKKHLHLKVGVPVILIVNLADELANGSRGIVREILPESVKVAFEGREGLTNISPFRFTIFRLDLHKNIAVRKQLPLHLAFALTVHKCQGVTLENMELDCRHMTRPGQIGVAIGRARTTYGLRVRNFKKSLLTPHPHIVNDFYNAESREILQTLACCKRKFSIEQLSSPVSDIAPPDELGDDNITPEEIDSEIDSDNEVEGFMIQLVNVIDSQESEIFNTVIPSALDVLTLLNGIEYANPLTPEQIALNDQVKVLKAGRDLTGVFVRRVYCKLQQLFDLTVTEAQFTNRSFTNFYAAVTAFIGSDDYKQYVDGLFMCGELKPVHFRLAFGILQAIRTEITAIASEPLKVSASESAIGAKRTFQGSDSGRAKLRYIAGWCVATLRHQKRKQVQSKLYSSSGREFVNSTHIEVTILDNLVESESSLMDTSIDKVSLLEIQRKNVRGGLCMVSDSAFNWFQNLDTFIRNLETDENINVHGKYFYTFLSSAVASSDTLNKQWSDLFGVNSDDSLIPQCEKVKQQLIAKYIRMSSAQFRKEFKRKLMVKKHEAHRKQIRMRIEPSPQSAPSTSTSMPSKSSTHSDTAQPGKRKPIKAVQTGKGKGKGKKQKKAKWPCGKCEESCVVECVGCDRCDLWYHYQCVGLTGDEVVLKEEEWYCPDCQDE